MSKISDEKIDEIARDYKAILLGENPYFPWFDFARAIEAAVLEAQPTDQRLINLLCRIHRDGGHYIAEHGLDKAVEDADMRVAEQNAVLDAQVKQEPVAWWCEGYFDDEEEAQNYCDTKAQIAESITPLYAAPVVQPDMVMVPREPTMAMREAIESSAVVTFSRTKAIYAAMIAAAGGSHEP